MRKVILLVGAAMGALVVAIAGPTVLSTGALTASRPSTPSLMVTVACKATPEPTRIKNNHNRTITIKKVGSIYQPYSGEPFMVNRRLGGGRAITFESGSGADQNVLTRRYIYNNEVGSREGSRGPSRFGEPAS